MIPMISHDIPWPPLGPLQLAVCQQSRLHQAPGLQVQRFLRKLSCHHSSPLLFSPRQNLLQCRGPCCKISPQPTVQCVESKPLPGTRYHPCLVPWRLFTLGETRRQPRQERERHKPSFSQGSNFVVDRQYSSLAGSRPGLAANILLSPQILNLSRLELWQLRTGELAIII